MVKVRWALAGTVWLDSKLLCSFLRIKFTFLVLSTSPSSLTLSVTQRRAVMSCSCPAAATSSRTGTASVALPRNGLTLSFQVIQGSTGYLYRVWGSWEKLLMSSVWMFLRCVGKEPILSLSHSVCSDMLFLHLFLKIGLSVVVLWPFLSTPQSKHALSYWKQIWSWFCSNTVLVLHDIHLHCLCLVLLSTGSTFFI